MCKDRQDQGPLGGVASTDLDLTRFWQFVAKLNHVYGAIAKKFPSGKATFTELSKLTS